MSTKAEKFNTAQLNQNVPDVKPGDIVRVRQKIKEGDPSAGSGQVKERLQVFEGVVIARKHGSGLSSTITVRKVIEGIGAERIFPVHAPFIDKIEVVSSGKTRRAKLYYLRKAKGVKARLKRKNLVSAIAPVATATESAEEVPEKTRTTEEAAAST